jgi:hypothetical protein
MGPYFDHETPLENEFTLGYVIIYPRWLGAIFHQVPVIVTIETFDLQKVSFRLLRHRLFIFVIMKPQLMLAPLAFVLAFASTTFIGMMILGDLASNLTLGRKGPLSSMHSTIFIKPW